MGYYKNKYLEDFPPDYEPPDDFYEWCELVEASLKTEQAGEPGIRQPAVVK